MWLNIMNPKVSIIMNCYNGEKYLKEAIDSIYAQSFNDWEIIFWDNASTDSSASIAKSYCNKLRYFFYPENTTLGQARKLAMEKANAEWVAFLDVDDYWYENKLEEQLRGISGSDYILCYAGVREVDSEGKYIRDNIPKYESGIQVKQQLNQFNVNMVTALINKKKMDELGLTFNPEMQASEEYNLFIRMSLVGRFFTIPKALGVYRVSDKSLTNEKNYRWSQERFDTLNLIKDNEYVIQECQSELKEAYSRGTYYLARYYMDINQKNKAIEQLITIRSNGFKYHLLYYVAFSRYLWNFFHSQKIKRVISILINRFS